MNRLAIRGMVYNLLGTTEADQFYLPATVNPWIQAAVNAILQRIRDTNPDFFRKTATLAPVPSTGRAYPLASQTPAITDFSGVLELRFTDDGGNELTEVRGRDLNSCAGNGYALEGADESAVLTLATAADVGLALYLKYAYWPAELDDDTDEPDGIPSRFHDLVAYETAEILFGFGDEQQMPGSIQKVKLDRDAQLLMHVARRSGDLLGVRGSDNVSGYSGSTL